MSHWRWCRVMLSPSFRLAGDSKKKRKRKSILFVVTLFKLISFLTKNKTAWREITSFVRNVFLMPTIAKENTRGWHWNATIWINFKRPFHIITQKFVFHWLRILMITKHIHVDKSRNYIRWVTKLYHKQYLIV